ncbi:MAG: hypothetical protein IJO03_06855 [Clostridia bacterium]|nr:hypothetical protein [Clostridia bacterium]
MKRFIAMLLAISMLFAFASCGGKEDGEDARTELVTGNDGEAVTNNEGEFITEIVTEAPSGSAESTGTTAEETTLEPVSAPSDDPSTWTDEQIVEFYKAAAVRSKTKVKSKEAKVINEISVNNGTGFIGKVVAWATPFLEDALKDSITEFDGITGGYENLSVSDTASTKAYKSGEYTVIEMTLKEQTDGAHGDRFSGTVGHAISVVGDLSVVADALPMFNVDFDNADIKLRYANPKLKVKINKDGIIEKGTWSYTVNVTIAELVASADAFPAIVVTIEDAFGSVGYVITTGGGF